MNFRKRTTVATSSLSAPTVDELEVVQRVSRRGTVTFGAPTRCPQCDTYGFVERVDLVGRATENRCPSCHHVWRITQAAIRATGADQPKPDVRPVGDGILVRDLARAS